MRQSAFLYIITKKKHSTTKHIPLDIISATNNQNLIQETIENRKEKENRGIFEISHVVDIERILNYNIITLILNLDLEAYKLTDERNYVWQWKDNKMNGCGISQWADSKWYEGDFKWIWQRKRHLK